MREVEDPYEWDTAFLASLVYNGGIVDLDFINDERNKEFWSWYLTDCIKTACSDDRLPYPASTSKVTPSAKYIPYRTQLNLWKDDEKCCAYVNSIKEILAKMVAYASGVNVIFTVIPLKTHLILRFTITGETSQFNFVLVLMLQYTFQEK